MCTQRIKGQGTLYYWLRLWLQNPKQISGKVERASHLDSCKEPRSKTSLVLGTKELGLVLYWELLIIKKVRNRAFSEKNYFPCMWCRLIDLEFN